MEELLKAKINHTIKSWLKTDGGFPEDEAMSYFNDYVVVDIEDAEDDKLKIEIRAELSYEGMESLSEKLDKILSAYDEDAYFEQVCPGIMEAFLDKSSLVLKKEVSA